MCGWLNLSVRGPGRPGARSRRSCGSSLPRRRGIAELDELNAGLREKYGELLGLDTADPRGTRSVRMIVVHASVIVKWFILEVAAPAKARLSAADELIAPELAR
jgi:hypothetical protein